ncbi:MAG: glycosyltransferase family 2 protein [Acidobacteria bacterium]|nr:glycosyltransferase family 2 protein [Acidobacteriota bacterium]
MKSIGAVIVTWNSEQDIAECIAAAKKAGVAETVVVDNGSKDRTREIVAAIDGVKLLYFPENLGFAGGVNQGVAALSSNFALILNPDCLVQTGLDAMAEAARGGAAGGMLLGASGELQTGFAVRRLPTASTLIFEVLGLNRLFPGNRVNQRYRCVDFDASRAQEVEQPPGAFLMVRKDIFKKLNGMDEGFWPVWFEDVDFCLRLREAGHKIIYCPAARAKHRGGASIEKILWPFKELAWYGSLLRYATQHFGWLSGRLVCLAVAAASVPRALTGIIYRRQGVRALGVYADIFCLAWVSLVLDRVDHRRFSRHAEGAEHL